jgi:hypothetical protein
MGKDQWLVDVKVECISYEIIGDCCISLIGQDCVAVVGIGKIMFDIRIWNRELSYTNVNGISRNLSSGN